MELDLKTKLQLAAILISSGTEGQREEAINFVNSLPQLVPQPEHEAGGPIPGNDRSFLWWIHERLMHVHFEGENVDYMWRLRGIIDTIPAYQKTHANVSREKLAEEFKRG